MATLIKKETLDRIFNDRKKMHHYEKGRCFCCGSEGSIQIDRLPGNYGLIGGVLYEDTGGQLLIKCEQCMNGNGNQVKNVAIGPMH